MPEKWLFVVDMIVICDDLNPPTIFRGYLIRQERGLDAVKPAISAWCTAKLALFETPPKYTFKPIVRWVAFDEINDRDAILNGVEDVEEFLQLSGRTDAQKTPHGLESLERQMQKFFEDKGRA